MQDDSQSQNDSPNPEQPKPAPPVRLPFPDNLTSPLPESQPANTDPGTSRQYHPIEPYDSTVAAKHADSVRMYPELRLNPDEYVIEVVRRSAVGLIAMWTFDVLMVAAVMSLLPLYAINRNTLVSISNIQLPSAAVLSIPLLIVGLLIVIGGLFSTKVYESNIFYLTCQNVIQHSRHSLFNTRLRLIGLINIDDASADKNGFLQQVLNYGTVQIVTEGKTTVFAYIHDPQKVADDINEAIEQARKNLENPHG